MALTVGTAEDSGRREIEREREPLLTLPSGIIYTTYHRVLEAAPNIPQTLLLRILHTTRKYHIRYYS